jgi:hypothetical protein
MDFLYGEYTSFGDAHKGVGKVLNVFWLHDAGRKSRNLSSYTRHKAPKTVTKRQLIDK